MLKELIFNKDVKTLSKTLFNVILTSKQEELVRTIAYKEHKRIIANAMTRYGKSMSISVAVLLYILFNENKKIKIIAPTYPQARIIMNYMADYLSRTDILVNLIEYEASGADRLKKEVTKSRITFKNGCELMILSAEGKAARIMGFGGDLVILDESCLVPLEVYQERISRMLGDDPDSMLVEIGNPFDKNNQFYQHWTDPKFFKIHVDWRTALAEGRVTKEFIEEQKLNLTSLQFRILYEADFPDEATDQLFPEKALKKMIYLPERDEPHFMKHPCTVRKLGVDIARFGLDLTVLITIEFRGGIYYITDIIYYEKQDTMVTVGKIKNLHEKTFFDAINVDEPGLGGGPFDRLKEVITNSSVIPFVGGSDTPQEKEKYLNCKAFWYLQLVKNASDGKVKILNHPNRSRLLMELRELRYDFDSRGRVRIIKEKTKKSPDFADALNIGMFEGNDFFVEFV